MSNLINKAKAVLTGEPTTQTTTNTTTTTGGVTGTHHNHHVGRDAAVGAGGVGIAEHEHRKHERERAAAYDGGLTTNTGGATSASTADGAGPHSSSILNKLDPNVDSTTGAVKTSSGVTGTTVGAGGVTGTHHNHHVGRDAAVGVGGVGIAEHEHRKHERERATGGVTTTTTGTTGSAGPHSSSLLNKLDPRVDSTTGAVKTSSGVTGTTAGTTTGTTAGTHAHSTIGGNRYATGTAEGVNGPHSSRLANTLDPRVDSDADGSTRIGATHATPGQGVTQNTAGPHNSDLLNKLDPRIDSDPNRTTNRTYVASGNQDHLDAARVPPSVLREHLGDPEITHDHPEHNHQGRHGSLASQDGYRGI